MSLRPGLPRLTALALTSDHPRAACARSRRRTAARCQPGPRPVPRATSAKGSARSDQLARHRLSPPLMVVSASTCASGSSVTKRDGMDEVHWP